MRTLAACFGKLVVMSAEPVVIAERGGVVVAERGSDILVVDRGNAVAEVTAFVLLVFALVFGGFGVVTICVAVLGKDTPPPLALAAAALVIGLSAGVGVFFAVQSIRDRRRRALSSFTPVAVFDRAAGIYRDGAGRPIAPLDSVHFERRLQVTSSSPKLVAITPSGTHILKRGNPFGGGVGELDRILHDAVHGRRDVR